MNMLRAVVLVASLVATVARSAPTMAPPAPSVTNWLDTPAPLNMGGPRTTTALFEAVVWSYYDMTKKCTQPTRGIPSRRVISKHIPAIIKACEPFGGRESDWYLMLGLLLSEGGGFMAENSNPAEKTYGPYCSMIVVVRMTCEMWPWMGCPRTDAGIRLKVETDPFWAAQVTRGTWQRLLEEQRGDRVTALTCYKMGTAGARNACFQDGKRVRQPWELRVWRRFTEDLSILACLRDHLSMSGTVPDCACFPRR
jgi:hypothetical protein